MPFKPNFPVEEFTMLGVKLAAPPEAFIANYARNNVAYEAHVYKHLLSSLFAGGTFIDIGANVGLYSLAAAAIVGIDGHVIAVEADQANAQCIKYGAMLNNFYNVEVWPVAASNKLRTEALLINPSTNSGTRSLSAVSEDSYALCLGIPVDKLVSELARVDVIKIDVEAREFPAMTGCLRTLEKFKPQVFSEFTPHAMKEVGGYEPDEYLNLFFDLGYNATVLHLNGDKMSCGTSKSDIYRILAEEAYSQHGYLDLLFD